MMIDGIDIAAAQALPFIQHVPGDGRHLMLEPWFDHATGEWHVYALAGGRLIRIAGARLAVGLYYAARPVRATDWEMPLATFTAQHLSFPAPASAMRKLVTDVNLLCAVYRKLELFEALTEEDNRSVALMVSSEVEYLLTLVRAMYDLVQKFAKAALQLLKDTSDSPVVAELPNSFAKMALDDKRSTPRTPDELHSKYRLPMDVAALVARQAAHFAIIRQLRVGIEHHGHTTPTIFVTAQGLAVDTKSRGWSDLAIWSMHEKMPNEVGSVRAMAAFLGSQVLEFSRALTLALSGLGELPRAVAPGNYVYLTGPHVDRLGDLQRMMRSPWLVTRPDGSTGQAGQPP